MTNDKDRGDELTIAYLLGVRHGREDERAKIAAETSQPTQSDALREALETARDYVADVAVGNIHFNDNIKAMAAEDLTRIDAALQEQGKCP